MKSYSLASPLAAIVLVIGVGGCQRPAPAGWQGYLEGEFVRRCNTAMVDLEPVLSEAEQQARLSRDLWHLGRSDEALLRSLVERHARVTGSRRAQQVLADWASYRSKFVKVFPKEYRRALAELAHKKVAA